MALSPADEQRLNTAVAESDQTLAQSPDNASAWASRGDALSELGRVDEARDSYGRALELWPRLHKTRADLACLHEACGDINLAFEQWDRLAHQTRAGGEFGQTILALNQMGRILTTIVRDYVGAEAVARQILEINPRHGDAAQDLVNARMRQCAWPAIAPFGRVTREVLLACASPLTVCAYTDDPLFQMAINARRNPRIQPGASAPTPVATPRLRIGYLSSDLRTHAVGQLMYEVPGLHDRSRVEVFLYYCGPRLDDPIHAHYRRQGDHFVDISQLDDAAAARRIADDGIQILVDLNGQTMHNRTEVLALKPAPVVVNWLGFPGTMGGPHHHYIIADDWIIPPAHERYYTEQVLRLACYMPANRQREVSDVVPTRAEAGLPEGAFVFCCFNDSRKITRHTFNRWMTILQRVPNSVLWLHRNAGPGREQLFDHARKMGIDPERIILAEATPTVAEHLARYPLADLFLDTTPYGAHTTCSDALWMGVPVVTYSGRSFASRVCGSLVRSAGLPELVCTRSEDYTDLAVALANDPGRLAGYKDRLKASRDTCTLFDTPALVRRLEALYASMWDDALAGRLPTPDLSNMDAYLKVGLAHDHEAVELQTIEDYEDLRRGELESLGVAWPPVRGDRA